LIYFVALKAQNYSKTYYTETLDSMTLKEYENFFSTNYPNHHDNFYMHFCTIYEDEDTVRYIKNRMDKFYLRKYLFVITFNDSILGINNYLINLSFNKNFEVTFFNFPHISGCKDLRITTRNEIINEALLIKPNFKDSIQFINTEVIYNEETDCFLWEVCLEKEEKNYKCLKFDAFDKKLIEEYGKMIISISN